MLCRMIRYTHEHLPLLCWLTISLELPDSEMSSTKRQVNAFPIYRFPTLVLFKSRTEAKNIANILFIFYNIVFSMKLKRTETYKILYLMCVMYVEII